MSIQLFDLTSRFIFTFVRYVNVLFTILLRFVMNGIKLIFIFVVLLKTQGIGHVYR